MAVELGPCVRQLLCGVLNQAARAAFQQAVGFLIVQLEAQLTPLKAYLIYLDILTAPLNLAASSLKQIAAQLRGLTGLLPVNLVLQCADLNKFIEGWDLAFSSDIAFIDRQINELNRYLSLRDEIAAIIADLEASLAILKEFELVIIECSNDDNA